MNQTGKIQIIIQRGAHVLNANPALVKKVKDDLKFKNPKYETAKRYGTWIGQDTPAHLLYFAYRPEDNILYIPRGYVFYFIRHLKQEGIEYEIQDRTTLKNQLSLEFKGKLRDYQEGAITGIIRYPGGILESGTGCLTGDTEIRLNRCGKGFKTTLKMAYEQFNGIEVFGMQKYRDTERVKKRKMWDLTTPTFIRSFNHRKKQILLNTVEEIVYSGEKEVYEIKLESGKKLKGTFNHKIMTNKGWKELGKLKKNDLVMVDSHRASKSETTTEKKWYNVLKNIYFHPYSVKPLYRRPVHVLVYEAKLNNMDIDKFINILQTSAKKSGKLKFVNPKTHVVHHINEDHKDNDPSNLELMTKRDHYIHHSSDNKKNFNQGIPSYEYVVARKYIGVESTYDICCKAPYHNFTANDIVVHNSGKTTMGIYMIAKRQQPTLIIVHSKELLYQWQQRLKQFLGYDCGLVGDGKTVIKDITVGIIQSVKNRMDDLKDRFGHIICDEVHRSPATTWVSVLDQVSAKYLLGLSATAYRNDGLGNVMNAFIGPKIHVVNKTALQESKAVLKPVIHRIQTSFYVFYTDYTSLISEIVSNKERNKLIVKTAINYSKQENRQFLIVSDRVDHCIELADQLEAAGIPVAVLSSGVPKAERKQIVEEVNKGRIKALISTTQLISEGFDAPNLHALFITTPIKYKGKLIQVVGRILRPEEGKTAELFDFRDDSVKMLQRMGAERDKTYRREKWA